VTLDECPYSQTYLEKAYPQLPGEAFGQNEENGQGAENAEIGS
jgi:hypothetical protein